MAWIRLSDDYIEHPKFLALSAEAFRLWHQGMAFCRTYQTDGLIGTKTLKGFKSYSPKRERELTTPWMEGRNPLWVPVEGFGVKVHDYLEWNLSKEEETQQRAEAKQRMALGRDTELRNALRIRDGGRCRYCASLVSWTDRRGPRGATYDHVQPKGPSTIENLVVACRGCNSKKGSRTPDEAGMQLLPESAEIPLRDLNRIQVPSISNLGISGKGMERRSVRDSSEEREIERAGNLVENYRDWFATYRRGARLPIMGNSVEFNAALPLVRTWDDARLEKLARIVLTTDEPWISGTDRSFIIFSKKAAWADDRLRQAESAAV